MILSDLSIVEKRLEKVAKDAQRGRKELAHELELLQKAHKILDDGKPLSLLPDVNDNPEFRGFSFLSSKPQLVLLNAGDNKSREQISRELELLKGQSEGQPNLAFDWLYPDAKRRLRPYLKRTPKNSWVIWIWKKEPTTVSSRRHSHC